MPIPIPVVVCAAAVGALLVAEARHSRSAVWLTKPVAAGAFVWAAVAWGAWDSGYGRWLLLGLVLSFLGDVLLIPRSRRSWFRAGLLAFLLAHVAYAVAFLRLPIGMTGLVLGNLCAAGLAWLVLSWLVPRLSAGFRRLVMAYVVVICVMLVAAFATADGSGIWTIALGASLFAISDLSVARDRFVARAFVNRLWGLPLYFAAQLILASTVGL
jgi:uncharacterized membrane protein YhhN